MGGGAFWWRKRGGQWAWEMGWGVREGGGGCMGSFQSDFDNLAEKVSIVCALMMF